MSWKQLYEKAKEGLEEFLRTLETTTQELDFVPEESQFGAVQLVEPSRSLEDEWNTLRQQQPASEDELQAFISRIEVARGKLSILVERGMHRQNLGVLEQQLALHRGTIINDQLQTTLRHQMDFETDEITRLEAKTRLDTANQELLAIHHNNLRIFQEMLSGQRPYAPLHLVNSVTLEEQAIQEIDKRLASL